MTNHLIMKKITPILSSLLLLISIGCSQKSLLYKNANTQSACDAQKGYWYNEQCWKGYEDEGISKEDLEQEVEKQMAIIDKTVVIINDKSYSSLF